MTEFSKRVIDIILAIPPGKIMTYGQISRAAGSPNGSRQVSRILHSCSKKHKLPWHRVINSKGIISLKGEAGITQKELLEAEGVSLEILRNDPAAYVHEA